MSKESSEKGQQDRSKDEYKPPSDPCIFDSEEKKEQAYKDKQDYDRSWEVTKGQQDFSEDKYNPPSTPSIFDSKYVADKKWSEREAYDKSWEDSKTNSDNQKEEKDGGGCFITAACVNARGLKDNCSELQTLRNFRDTFIAKMPNGNSLIQEYYNTAPKIVSNIDKNSERREIYDWLYDELVQKSLSHIKSGDNLSAFNNYTSIFERLKKTYLS